jgi:hypothetical protein
MAPLDAASSPAARRLGLEHAVLWSEGADSAALEERLARWETAGYRLQRATRLDTRDGRRWVVYFMTRS